MRFDHAACVCAGIAIASAVLSAQQGGGAPADRPSQSPASRVIETIYSGDSVAPARRTLTRSVSADREVVVETIETPNLNGRLEPSMQLVAETSQPAIDRLRTRRDLFALGFSTSRTSGTSGTPGTAQGRRLVETTESTEIFSGARTTTIENTWVPDVNGRPFLTSRFIGTTTVLGPDELEGEGTLLIPTIEGTLQEAERTRFADRPIDRGLRRQESNRLLRDVNGRWQPAEAQRREVRDLGPSETIEEETLESVNPSGTLSPSERTVTRRGLSNGREEVVIETYARDHEGRVRSDSQYGLTRRIRVSSAAAADGSRSTIEEVEERNPVALKDPLRVVRRTVTTVRQLGPDLWRTERQIFERDQNGRLARIATESEETRDR